MDGEEATSSPQGSDGGDLPRYPASLRSACTADWGNKEAFLPVEPKRHFEGTEQRLVVGWGEDRVPYCGGCRRSNREDIPVCQGNTRRNGEGRQYCLAD